MTLHEIYELLDGKVKPDGSLLLEAGLFSELAAALKAFALTELKLAGAHVAEPGPVTVDGKGVMLGSKKPGDVHLDVTEDPGTKAIVAALSFTAPSGWGIADGFPGLPNSYTSSESHPGFVTFGDSVLYELVLDSAKVTGKSGSDELEFKGVIADKAYFTFLADPLKLPDKPPLTGTIQLRDHAAPEADLTVSAGSSTLKIGSLLTFDEVGIRTHTIAHDPSTDTALTRMDLDATLEVGNTDPVPVKLAAPFYGRSDMLGLSADFGEAGLSIDRGIRAFAELLNLPAGDFTLPKPLDVLGKFGLQTIACVVTLEPASVQRLVITVGPGQKWPIVDGIEVDDLTIGWAITYPFDSDARWLSASISGRLALGTLDPRLEFDIYAATDNGFAASGQLTRPITLAQIATTINGSPVPGLPDLTVINAGVTAATSGDFGVVVSVGNWHLGDVGGTPIMLYEVTAEFQRQAGTLQGQFLVVFGVGKARLYLAAEITMGAALPQAANTSWVLEGGTQPDTEIEIGEFLKELSDTFGIKEVPEPIRSLKLTALKLRYESANSKFNFTATAKFKVEATEVTVTVTIDIAPTSEMEAAVNDPLVATVNGTKGHSAKFGGEVSFAGLRFNIVFDTEDEKTDVLIASYVHDAEATALRDLVEPISPEVAREIPAGISIDIKEVKFVFLKQTETRWAFGLRLGKLEGIRLSELPIVGSRLPADQTLAVDALQILYSSGDLDEKQTKIINPLLPKRVAKLPETVGKGIAFDADVILGSTTKRLHAGVTPPKPALPAGPVLPAGPQLPAASGLPAAAANAPATPASSTDPVKWLDVNKQFGVFSFERVGVGYQNNILEFALDASVALGPVAFSMQGLSVGSPLTKFDPQFSINGLALAYDRPPLTLGGAFLNVKEQADGKEFTSYYGQVMVKMSRFGLSALGGWSPDADPAMFFLYLAIHAPIGGPPELYITGLAGGFGVNSSLRLPTIDEVGGYQLLPANAPSPEGNAAETIKNVIPALQKTFRPKADQYWVAAGIELTSYEMIKAQAVVSVAFGVELQIGVVGTCSMTLPTSAGNAQPLAYLEIEVVASFTPSTGLLAIDGKISPASFIFGGFVKLTGGFAFYVWFSGEHQSDFVVSLGGYHPAFEKPGHYPVVPRLGVAFALGPIKVLGQAYFALTPGAFMAGIRISATFSAGPVSAWFDAGVDFLVRWAPLHYEAAAWVTIGCSVDLGLFSIKVQVGANVQIWGPDFGGTAEVDLDVVSFTIAFGAKNTQPLPVGWKTFSANFLPAPQKPPERVMALAAGARDAAAALGAAEPPAPVTNVIKATVEAGLISPGPAGVDWIVDPNHFRIRTDSTAPANHGVWATAEKTSDELPNIVANYRRVAPAPPLLEAAGEVGAVPPEMELLLDYQTKTFSAKKVWAPTLNIAPMEVKAVKSFHTIALRKYDTKSGGYTRYITGVAVTPQLRSSSTALWGEQEQKPKPNAARLIEATLSGFAISPITRKPDQVSDVSLLSLIFGEGHDTGFRYQRPTVDSRYTVSSSVSDEGTTFKIDVEGDYTATLTNHDYVLSSVDEQWVRTQRASTLDELRNLGFHTLPSDEVHLTEMAKIPLTDWPSAGRIGALR